jgi:hypothetical protein
MDLAYECRFISNKGMKIVDLNLVATQKENSLERPSDAAPVRTCRNGNWRRIKRKEARKPFRGFEGAPERRAVNSTGGSGASAQLNLFGYFPHEREY